MERIAWILRKLRDNPVISIRYILIVAGLFCSFNNLFECIVKNNPVRDYFLYVVVLGVITLLLVFIEHNSIVCFVLAITGMAMVIDMDNPGSISSGIVFLIFSKRIANSLIYSLLLYFITAIVIVASTVFKDKSATDSVNVIIGYYALYMIDYILSGVKNK